MNDSTHWPVFSAGVYYDDTWAALEFLEKAFGFERSMVITDQDGHPVHCEMAYGDGRIMVGSPWADFIATPGAVGNRNTQMVHVHLQQDIDAHCQRAKAAGAEILQEPEDQFYGDRTYRARDPGGHVWTFSQTTRHVTREEAEQAMGLKIEGWH
jgi:uncharacterized glyoxalase superfamily protein PhnB